MLELKTVLYTTTGPVARITLNRPERGNGITLDMPQELAALRRAGQPRPRRPRHRPQRQRPGFCGGYDLVAEILPSCRRGMRPATRPGSPLDPAVIARNHDPPTPGTPWSTTP
jgi:enoyl-CoA hydratase